MRIPTWPLVTYPGDEPKMPQDCGPVVYSGSVTISTCPFMVDTICRSAHTCEAFAAEGTSRPSALATAY